ncbi:hypothetical protein JZ785_07110 [Alicyclobacillus curvatus]|nr:hypothetical protein JZ785_07110 [Alicyclobacillus curvatus]
MKSEQETIETLSAAAAAEDLKMTHSKQQEIWNALEVEMDRKRPQHTRRHNRNSLLGTSAAILAALVIVIGGIYFFQNRVPHSVNKISHPTTAANTPKNPFITQIPNVKYNLMPTLNKVEFHYTLPSWLPYTPAMVASNGMGATPDSTQYAAFMVDFFSTVQSGEQMDVNIQEESTPTNPLTKSQGTQVYLNNNVIADFNPKGPNGTTLSWYAKGIVYTLSAAKIDTKAKTSMPGLDEATLLKIANSFK